MNFSQVSPDTKIGILMLETQFPRLRGDIGNSESFKNQVLYKTVKGASPQKVVRVQSKDLLAPFIDGARDLVSQGAGLITTSCGFLVSFQTQLQAAIAVPVVTSSLLMFKRLAATYGADGVGILTIAQSSLTPELLKHADIPIEASIGSTESGIEFTAAILENRKIFDVKQCERDLVDAAVKLHQSTPTLKCILLECTNMPPHKQAITDATGLAVYSIMDCLLPAQ